MILNSDDLSDLCQCAVSAATQAGLMIAEHADKTVEVQRKQGGDGVASQVLTEVDLRSEAIIVDVIKPTCGRYDLALLTEESADDKTRLQKDYFWCIDPMDGTLSFIESTPGYAVSIALVSQSGQPVIGVIYDPVTHTLYSAVSGQGVKRNGKPWLRKPPHVQGSLTLVCDRGFMGKSYFHQLLEALRSMAIKHGYSGLRILERNGAVLNACYVLENPPAIYFKCPKPEQGGGSLWDFAATAALFSELGYVASDFYGQALELNRAESTFMNHRGVMFGLDQALLTQVQDLVKLCEAG